MSSRLFVGNLSWNTNDDSLKAHFSQSGNVVSANVIMDKMTGRSRGFAFVEMESDDATEKALTLNGSTLDGRQINVNVARPKEDRPMGGNRGPQNFRRN